MAGGEIEPFIGLDIILLHALTVGIKEAEIALGKGVAASGGFGIPLGCLGIILLHAVTVGIDEGEPVSAKRSLWVAALRYQSAACA